LLSPAYTPAIIAAVVAAVVAVYADRQNRALIYQTKRADAQERVTLISTKFQADINANLQLARSLASVITAEPELSEARFENLASNIFKSPNQLRAISAAPDLVVKYVYPRAGNEALMGVNLLDTPLRRASVERARDTREMTLNGPNDLNGSLGRSIIGRVPIYVDDADGRSRFWGIVSAAIDVERLFRETGLLDSHGLSISIVNPEGERKEGPTQVFGSSEVDAQSPVVTYVSLPSSPWRVAAVPTGGWAPAATEIWPMRALIMLAGALIVAPIALAGRFYVDRQKNYDALRGNEAKLQRLFHRHEIALDASHIGVWEMDINSGTVLWDDRLYEIYGMSREGRAPRYEDWEAAIHPDDLALAKGDVQRAVEGDDQLYSSTFRIVRPNGQIRYVKSYAKVMDEVPGHPRMIGAEWDITEDVHLNQALERARILAETRSAELEVAKARIEHNSLHDPLTGLPNRRYLDEELDRQKKATSDLDLALLHIDLDRFKQINDTLGHGAGDAMLMHVAQLLRQNVRREDFVARIGGDEFVIVCPVARGSDYLDDIASRIIRQVSRPVSYQGHQCRFGVSIGIAVEPDRAAMDAGRLLVNADIALYRAKSRGRNRYEFFTAALQAEIVKNREVADDILGGLERGEFITYFQPQFDARTNEIAGVESLIRWAHPTEGILMPDMFLRTAEELNVVSAIDQIALEQTLANFERWNKMGLRVPRVSVNVSARRLHDEELIASVKRLNIKPGTLSFELLESIFLDETDEIARWNVDQLKELGIDIEIDDFGTGYASIVSLLKLQPRRLKIDRQLIQPIVKAPRQRHLVESIVDIGKTLGIAVIAEGVETVEHARILKKIGCDELQGYAFGQPLNAADLEQYLRNRSWRAVS
jgi:diguanylate cyclase (GGDEF)-like protein/PAS domain S-box-containing protein